MAAETPKGDTPKGVTPESVTEVIGFPPEDMENTMAVKEQSLSTDVSIPMMPSAVIGTGIKWFEMSARNLQPMLMASQGAMKHLLDCQHATLNFTADRLQKSQAAARACFDSRDPVELIHLSADYHRTMIEDYAQFTKQLADMGIAAANEHLGPLQQRAQESLGEAKKVAEGRKVG